MRFFKASKTITFGLKLPNVSGIDLSHWIRGDQAAPHYYGILLVAAGKSKNLAELVQLSGADTACNPDNLKNDLAARVSLLIKYKQLNDKANSLLNKLNHSKETIRELEDQDSITRLYNLPYMNTRLDKEFSHAERFKTSLSLVIMFIDNFKEISHIKGPSFCIKMLQQLGNDLIHITRADDIVGRTWGGEFILILPETKEDGAENLKNRISEHIKQHLYGLDHDRIAIELSFGTSTYRAEDGKMQTIQEMLLDAEDSLSQQLQHKSDQNNKKAANA